MEEVQMFGSFEEMLDAVEDATKEAIARMTPEQWKLCDGEAHFAFYIDPASIPHDPQVGVCRIRSRQEVLGGEYPQEASLWFDDEGKAWRGYLPCETWDEVFYPFPGVPDLHDRHASMLMEITEEQFEGMRALNCSFRSLAADPYYRGLLRWYVAMMAGVANGDNG